MGNACRESIRSGGINPAAVRHAQGSYDILPYQLGGALRLKPRTTSSPPFGFGRDQATRYWMLAAIVVIKAGSLLGRAGRFDGLVARKNFIFKPSLS